MVNIKRPAGVISIAFMLIVLFILELKGGVDEGSYYIHASGTEDGKIYLDENMVTVTGLIDEKIFKNNKYSIHMKDVIISKNEMTSLKKTNIIVYLADQNAENFYIGQRITATGEYRDFAIAENEGQFDMRRYYRIRGYCGSVINGRITGASDKYNGYREFLHKCRQGIKDIYYKNMSEVEAGTLSAIVTGDKSGLDENVKELYQLAGMAHVLSLSGLHIASIGLGIFTVLIRLGFGRTASSLISTLIMISYSVMTGMSTSTVRALIMFILGLIAKNLYRSYDLLSAVYLSAVFILFDNPYYIYDSGFLLSVSAVMGIGIVYPVMYDISSPAISEEKIMSTTSKNNVFRFDNLITCIRKIYDSKYLDKIRQGICISISVTIATAPTVMNSFYVLPKMGIILNIIVVPLMSILLGTGVIGGILCKMAGAFMSISFWGRSVSNSGSILCRCILFPAHIILKIYTGLAEGTQGIQESRWVTGRAEQGQIIVYITIVLGICIIYKAMSKSAKLRKLKKIAAITFFAIATAAITYRNKADFSINVLSVGQGACNVIYGKDVPVIIIDGGSTDVTDVYKYRIEPFLLSKGISQIDYLFITHADDDHISGIAEMLNDSMTCVSVKNIFIGDENELCKLNIAIDADESCLGLFRNTESKKCSRIYEFGAGDRIRKGNILVECISPEKNNRYSDENDNSLVLKLTYIPVDFSALFTGDISSEVEKKILQFDEIDGSNKIRNMDFMTVAHHGSKYSSSAEFLSCVDPKISTISSGLGNYYGHPHEETLDRLNNYAEKSRVFRTDECGQISVIINDKRVYVRRFIK